MPVAETSVPMLVTTFPSGIRDFLLLQPAQDGAFEALHPLKLLELNRTARLIERVAREQESLALVMALCRLLVPCLRYRGSGRHLLVEPWSMTDLRGESLPVDARTEFARELSVEQAREFQAITTGQKPAEGSLAELFWDAQTNLPALPPAFDDLDLGRLAKALYFFLVPKGHGLVEVDAPSLAAKVERLRAQGFAPLELGIPARQLRPSFRKLLAVTVRYSSQLTGAVAEEWVAQRLRRAHRCPVNQAEKELLTLRYGASRVLNDINVGFLFGSGPLLADLVNDYFLTLAGIRPEADRARAEELLRKFIYLLGGFQQRRKTARAQERREDRQRHADRMPQGPRRPADFQADRSALAPDRNAAIQEELERLKALLPLLKDRDAERLRAFIDCDGNRKAAATKLGIEHEVYSRQLRQTVFPAVRRLAKQEGFDDLFE
jgi:hypothetical protein